jgi:hypothetical protein
MAFEFNHIQAVEFGVCLDTGEGESYLRVPCDQGVQRALKEMLAETMASLMKVGTEIVTFSPAEKYGGNERLSVPLNSDLVQKHRNVFATGDFDTDTHGLDEPGVLISYFSIFYDRDGTKAMGFRRATQFKGVVRKHLVTFINDALQLVPDKLFKLDNDFDFVIFDDQILVWRPSGFIFTADMDEYIAACAAVNVERISEAVTCVDFTGLRDFVSKHKLAMRLVAAIKSRDDLMKISLNRLKTSCKANKVEFTTKNGKLMPNEGSEMDFLLLLDRRLYTVELIEKQPETYQASSRHLAKQLANS